MELRRSSASALTPAAGHGSESSMGRGRFPPRQQNVQWITIFGDLLTLILCFFIVVLSFARGEKVNDTRLLAEPERSRQVAQRVGTAIAHSEGNRADPLDGRRSVGGERSFLALSRDEVDSLEKAQKWIEGQQVTEGEVVEVRACSSAAAGPFLNRVAELLTEQTGGKVRLRFVELGLSCDELNYRFGNNHLGKRGADEWVLTLQIGKSVHG